MRIGERMTKRRRKKSAQKRRTIRKKRRWKKAETNSQHEAREREERTNYRR